MKRIIAKTLVLSLILSFAIVYSPATLKVDVVSAATTTPATTTTPTKVTPATPTITNGSKVYVVVSGDKMWKIAQKYNLSLDQLKALNPQIKNANLIYVGQKVIVGQAVSTATAPTTPTTPSVPGVSATGGSLKVYQGQGQTIAFRNGPGADSEKVPVYTFTMVLANATFDAQGRILNAYLDSYEVATPNYDGASMPHFSGWPGTPGYNTFDHATDKIIPGTANTLESATAEVTGWKTKRERGDAYGMNPANEWYKQMDFYQKFFVGKTVPELQAWVAKYTTAAGRPIKATTTKQDELDKLAKLTTAEKAQLADVVSGATMSLSDAHGDFIGALANAYANRVEVTIPVK